MVCPHFHHNTFNHCLYCRQVSLPSHEPLYSPSRAIGSTCLLAPVLFSVTAKVPFCQESIGVHGPMGHHHSLLCLEPTNPNLSHQAITQNDVVKSLSDVVPLGI